jgi:RNase P subunit RPR2
MIKTFCKKCKALNIVNLNIQGGGKIQMPCKKCGHTMVFDGSKKIIIKPKEVKNEKS